MNAILYLGREGAEFQISEYKLGIIFKHINELKMSWAFPLQNYEYYNIKPESIKTEWQNSVLIGERLIYILSNADEINKKLTPRKRIGSADIEAIAALVKTSVKMQAEKPQESAFVPKDNINIESSLMRNPANALHSQNAKVDISGLYTWQKEAFTAWADKCKKRGIVEAATGSGKTRLAFACIDKFRQDSKDGLVCIVVPWQTLFNQWKDETESHFPTLRTADLCLRGSGQNDAILPNTEIVIVMQRTLVTQQDEEFGTLLMKELINSKRDVLLVMDEAHHLGATETLERFVRYIPESFYTLGLSATPDRKDGEMDQVYPYINAEGIDGPIFSYSLLDAVSDGILSKVIQSNFEVSLNDKESNEHEKICKQIKDTKAKIIDNSILDVDAEKVNKGDIAYLLKLERRLKNLQIENPRNSYTIWNLINTIGLLKNRYIERRRIFNKAASKWELLGWLLSNVEWGGRFITGKWIFFHEEIEECERTYELVKKNVGVKNARIHYSELSKQVREQTMMAFRAGDFNCLCAVKTLDEGIDIPDLNGIVIVSGSTTKRQQIQRCGRALRRSVNKSHAEIICILTQVDDDLFGEKLLVGPQTSQEKWLVREYTYS